MPKILLIPEFDLFGGTLTYFKMLLDFYASQKYDVIVALSEKQADQEMRSFIERQGFRYCFIRERSRRFFKVWQRFPFSLFFDIVTLYPIYRRERPEVIVVSNGTPGIWFGLSLLPKRFLYIMHTYPLAGGRFSFLKKAVFSIGLTKGNRVLTCSDFAMKKIRDLFFFKNRSGAITVIRLTADTSPLPSRENTTANCGTFRVLTLGHVTWYKNPKVWVQVAQQVMNKLPGVPIEFIWAGDGDLLDECRDLVNEHYRGSIRFIGFQKDVDALYQGTSVYFQPSLIESQGLSVIDAMRRGIPCIVSDRGGLPESVIDSMSGFVVNAEDPDSMTMKIVLLLTDPRLSRKMGDAARHHYQETFSYLTWKSRMQAVHDELLLPHV